MPTGVRPEPPAGALRVAYEGTYLGTTWAVVHWFMAGGGPWLQADLDSVRDQLATIFSDELHGPMCSSSSHFTTTHCTVWLGGGSTKRQSIKVADAVGTMGGAPLPAQVSLLLNWHTIDGRRGGKPRSYMPAVTDDHVTEAALVKASTLGTLQGHIDDYVEDVNIITAGSFTSLRFVEMSFVEAKAYRLAAATFDIESGSVRPVLCTQRRRVDRAF